MILKENEDEDIKYSVIKNEEIDLNIHIKKQIVIVNQHKENDFQFSKKEKRKNGQEERVFVIRIILIVWFFWSVSFIGLFEICILFHVYSDFEKKHFIKVFYLFLFTDIVLILG